MRREKRKILNDKLTCSKPLAAMNNIKSQTPVHHALSIQSIPRAARYLTDCTLIKQKERKESTVKEIINYTVLKQGLKRLVTWEKRSLGSNTKTNRYEKVREQIAPSNSNQELNLFCKTVSCKSRGSLYQNLGEV